MQRKKLLKERMKCVAKDADLVVAFQKSADACGECDLYLFNFCRRDLAIERALDPPRTLQAAPPPQNHPCSRTHSWRHVLHLGGPRTSNRKICAEKIRRPTARLDKRERKITFWRISAAHQMLHVSCGHVAYPLVKRDGVKGERLTDCVWQEHEQRLTDNYSTGVAHTEEIEWGGLFTACSFKS